MNKILGTYTLKSAHTHHDNIDLIGDRLHRGLFNYTMSIINEKKSLLFRAIRIDIIVCFLTERNCLICHNDLANRNA